MDLKKKIIVFIAYSVALLALGAYLVPVKTKIETKTVTVEVDKSEENIKKFSHVTLKVTTMKKKDGTTIVTKTYVADKGNTIDKTQEETRSSTTETKKEVEKEKSYTTISVLGAVNVTNPTMGIAYGLSVNRDIVGPFGISVMGMSNGIVGAGLSVRF